MSESAANDARPIRSGFPENPGLLTLAPRLRGCARATPATVHPAPYEPQPRKDPLPGPARYTARVFRGSDSLPASVDAQEKCAGAPAHADRVTRSAESTPPATCRCATEWPALWRRVDRSSSSTFERIASLGAMTRALHLIHQPTVAAAGFYRDSGLRREFCEKLPLSLPLVNDAQRLPGVPLFIHRDKHQKFLVRVASNKLFHIAAAPPSCLDFGHSVRKTPHAALS